MVADCSNDVIAYFVIKLNNPQFLFYLFLLFPSPSPCMIVCVVGDLYSTRRRRERGEELIELEVYFGWFIIFVLEKQSSAVPEMADENNHCNWACMHGWWLKITLFSSINDVVISPLSKDFGDDLPLTIKYCLSQYKLRFGSKYSTTMFDSTAACLGVGRGDVMGKWQSTQHGRCTREE